MRSIATLLFSLACVIHFASAAPGPLGKHGVVFIGGQPGKYKVYLDNLRLRHATDRTTPIWINGKDTRFKTIADSEWFTHISVRAVPVSEVGK